MNCSFPFLSTGQIEEMLMENIAKFQEAKRKYQKTSDTKYKLEMYQCKQYQRDLIDNLQKYNNNLGIFMNIIIIIILLFSILISSVGILSPILPTSWVAIFVTFMIHRKYPLGTRLIISILWFPRLILYLLTPYIKQSFELFNRNLFT